MDWRMDDWRLSSRVSPFRYLRIVGYLLLPEAFRSLSRLSSALSAKASTLRSFLLDLVLRYIALYLRARHLSMTSFSALCSLEHFALRFLGLMSCNRYLSLIIIFCVKFSRYILILTQPSLVKTTLSFVNDLALNPFSSYTQINQVASGQWRWRDSNS